MSETFLLLTKHFGINNAGEIIGVSSETAAHILKHNGAELIGDVKALAAWRRAR